MTYAEALNPKPIPTVAVNASPFVPILGRESEMQPNHGGGYGFTVTWLTQLLRFLILGSDKGHYTSAKSNTMENVDGLKKMLMDGHGLEMCKVVNDVYQDGRAAKQDPTFVVLSLLCTSPVLDVRKAAWEIIVSFRTFSQLCSFLKYYMAANGGWGRLPKRSLNSWVTKHSARDLTYQVFKYLSREGWEFRDVLRCIHTDPKGLPIEIQTVLKLMVSYSKKGVNAIEAFDQAIAFAIENGSNPNDIAYIQAIRFLKTCAEDTPDVIPAISETIHKHAFTHEFLPKWALTHKEVWLALLMTSDGTRVKMPMTALVRNLATLTVRGVFDDETVVTAVVSHLTNAHVVKGSKIHPAVAFVAMKQYEVGHGEKGKQVWTPVQAIVTALESTIYLAFVNVKKTGKRIYHCFDGSGSMTTAMGCAGNATSAEAVALLGLICSRNEDPATQKYCVFSDETPDKYGYGYNYSKVTGLRPLVLNPTSSLKEAATITQIAKFGSTECPLPIEKKIEEFKTSFAPLSDLDKKRFQTALDSGDDVTRDAVLAALGIFLPEVFVIYTDNDANAGNRHTCQALVEYRALTGICAKMAVVATQASRVTIADPADAGMMDLVGFDTQLPSILHDFVSDKL